MWLFIYCHKAVHPVALLFFFFEDVSTNFCWPKLTSLAIQSVDVHCDMQAGIARTIFIAFHFRVWHVLLLEAQKMTKIYFSFT